METKVSHPTSRARVTPSPAAEETASSRSAVRKSTGSHRSIPFRMVPSSILFSFRQYPKSTISVWLPAIPSAVRPLAFWKARTAASVFASYSPFTSSRKPICSRHS